MAICDGFTISVGPEASTNVEVRGIQQSDLLSCSYIPMMDESSVDIEVFETPTVENIEFDCNSDGTMLVLAFEITGGDAASYQVNGLTGNLKGNEFISDSIPHNTPYEIEVTDMNNCTAIKAIGIAECFCTPDLAVNITVDKPVSCRGQKDAVLSATPVNLTAPLTYFWSNGATTSDVTSIAPGMSFVSVTDANGCVVADTVNLVEPNDIIANANALPISCFGEKDGGIFIFNVTPETGNYTYSFNNGPFMNNPLKEGLLSGTYDIAVKNEFGCVWTGQSTIIEPSQLDISLGGNVILNLGDSIALDPQTNQENLLFSWESTDSTLCADCPNPVVKPIESGRYKLTVINNSGCIASDQILVQVQNEKRIFFPSAFSPNGDGNNDIVKPFGGSEVAEISMFRIYNRWGELMYEKKEMRSIDGWDGVTMTGRKAPAGVYLYYAEVAFKNGTSEMMTGDISLIR